MAKRNGGIIGPSNVPTGIFGTAKGVWRLRDAFNYIKAGLWPIPLGYQIPNSARFNSASSDYLSRTPASTANANTYTFSTWVKKSENSNQVPGYQSLLSAADGSNNSINIGFGNGAFTAPGDYFEITYVNSSYTVQWSVRSDALYRDVSAWYHLMVAVDTTQATASNRIKLYVNGVTIPTTATSAPSQNTSYIINTNVAHNIGRYSKDANSFVDGYLAETYMIGGSQLTPSSFGQTDSTTGIWTPIAYTSTFGTNGFYLKFANSAALGTDSSGNGNTWTVNGLTSIDQSYDSPTNNFSTLNSLANNEVPNGNTFSYTDGALTFKGSAGVDTSQMMTVGTQAVSTGKWYWEAKLVSVGSDVPGIGILDTGANFNVQNAYPHNSAVSAYGYSYISNGTKENNNTNSAYGTSYTAGDIIGIALDMINNKLYFSKNGVFQNSGDPTSGATGTGAAFTVQSALTYFPACNLRYSPVAGEWSFNFGYPAFTIASGNADANGFGNFEYAVPSGYYALCTKNLALYG
jgi:hypothetical protein